MRRRVIGTVLGVTTVLLVAAAAFRAPNSAPDRASSLPVGVLPPPGAASTSREALLQTISQAERVLAERPTDSNAAVQLAEALLRQARILNHAGLPLRAETALDAVIKANASDYTARRMRAAVYLAQHRFRDALLEAGRCRELRGDDAWIDGVIGDASIELGDYPAAFAAFDRMMDEKPNAAAYARASYARELQGDLEGAIELMQMAVHATSSRDAEAQAWQAAQLGHLFLSTGDTTSARREYMRAEFLFPGHPFADAGMARVEVAEGQPAQALARLTRRLADTPSAAEFALAGDLQKELGQHEQAERSYRLAEAAWTSDTPEPALLAKLLATRGVRLPDAVRLAEETFAVRKDIFTADALAWAYFKSGRLDDARTAMVHALSTGSRDREIRQHATAIDEAVRTRRTGNR